MNKGQLVVQIAAKTGKSVYKAEQALNAVLEGIKHALGNGREVDLGPKLGRLVVKTRTSKRFIRKNLLGSCKTSIVERQRQAKTIRLLGRNRDLSENPQPTVVTKNPEPVRRVAIAFVKDFRR